MAWLCYGIHVEDSLVFKYLSTKSFFVTVSYDFLAVLYVFFRTFSKFCWLCFTFICRTCTLALNFCLPQSIFRKFVQCCLLQNSASQMVSEGRLGGSNKRWCNHANYRRVNFEFWKHIFSQSLAGAVLRKARIGEVFLFSQRFCHILKLSYVNKELVASKVNNCISIDCVFSSFIVVDTYNVLSSWRLGASSFSFSLLHLLCLHLFF